MSDTPQLPMEKRITVDEVYKVLMFNNRDPNTYNIQFWADHFKISPEVIRNIFNYLAFPVMDQKTKKIDEVLYFIDVDLMDKRKMITGLDRETYLKFLESDHRARMLEDYGDEAGLFGKGTLED
jgi:hypothetical protein